MFRLAILIRCDIYEDSHMLEVGIVKQSVVQPGRKVKAKAQRLDADEQAGRTSPG